MKKMLLLFLLLAGLHIIGFGQSGFNFSCARDTVLTCAQGCINLKVTIPDIHSSTNNYGVNLLSCSGCFRPPIAPETPGDASGIETDDVYPDNPANLSFDFPFYGVTYNSLLISPNGGVCFDLANAGLSTEYGILESGAGLTATNGGGQPADLPNNRYDRAIIMGPYHDIDIQYTTSPLRKVQYYELGTAPHRKWVVSFYKVPLYYTSGGCDQLIENTHEIVLYEGTGIVEVHVFDKQICNGWNEGRAMIGMQNYDRDNGIMAPGRAASNDPWGSIGMNESWRFVPSDGPTLFKRVELFNMAGTLVATGDTTIGTEQNLNVTFPNVCAPAGTYIIKSTYANINDPASEVYGYDTINIIRTTVGAPIVETVVAAQCGPTATGSITITAPAGPHVVYSADGGVTFQSANVIVKPAGSYNVVVKDTLTGCISTKTIVITTVTTLTATADSTITNCPGSATGTITVTASLGTPGYTYSIDNGPYQTSNVFSGLSAGPHAISVKDNASCVFSFSEIVTDGTGFTTTGAGTATSCPGISNGSITITQPSSGATPFTYALQGIGVPQSSGSFTGLAANSYTVVVKDANGCAFTIPVIVSAGAGFTTTASSTPAACSAASNGSITVAVPGAPGAAPFTYSIDAGTPVTNNVFNNLTPVTHNLVVTDANGCTFSFTKAITAGSGFTTTANAVPAACSTAANGSITVVTPTAPAVAPFSYALGAAPPTSNNTFTGLLPNNYSVTVTDGNGCSYTFNKTVTANAGFSTTLSTTNTSCLGVSTGTITIAPPTNAVAPITYDLLGDPQPSQTSNVFNGLGDGPYNILITDGNGCRQTLPATIGSNPGVMARDSVIKAACAAVNNGKIFIKASTGVAPFSYSNDGGTTYQLADSFTNLAAVPYSIRVRDAVGCYYDFTSTVGTLPGVLANYTLLKAACSGSATGTIIVRPTGGIAPFTYSLDGGVTLNADSVFRNLASGSYNITITDALGCTLTSPNQVIQNNPGVVTSAPTIQNASCATVPNGGITINTTAGIAPFEYTLNTAPVTAPQASNYFGNLFANTYSITIKDSAGCTKTINAIVGNNPKVQFTSLAIVRPTCNGLLNGTITVSASLGVTPYKYALDAGPYQTTNQFTGVGAGPHRIYVSDANNCTIDSLVTITQPNVLTAQAIRTAPATCTGTPDGSISASATGGTTPYSYTIDFTGANGYQSSNLFNVITGNYKVTVKDNLGCKATANVLVDSVFNMFLDLGKDSTICVGQSVKIKPLTNAATNLFVWTPKASLNDSTLREPTATPNDTTKYRLTATWGICTLKDSITINVLHKPVAHAGADTTICYKTTALLHGSATNTSGAVSYLWSPAIGLAKADTNITLVSPDTSRLYTLTVKDLYGCNFTVTDAIQVDMQPPVPAFAGNDTNAVTGIPHQLHGIGAGPGGNYQWSWSPGDAQVSNSFAQNPTAVMQNHVYYFYLIATDFATCKGYDTVKITVYDGPTYYVPNAFSPNGDGLNDKFHPTPVGIVKTEYFRIYNRYGKVIFESQSWNDGWDGYYLGVLQPLGTYVWVIKGKDRFGATKEFKGTVVLVQ